MLKPINIFLAFTLTLGLLAGCDKPVKKHYGALYRDAAGNYYTKTYDKTTDDFWFWMYVMNVNSSTTYATTSSSATALSGGSWQRAPSVSTSDLKPTNQVVEEKGEEPTEAIVEESAVPAAEVIDESTTVAEAAAIESASSESAATQSEGQTDFVHDAGTDSAEASDGGMSDGGGFDGGGGDGGGGGD
jgi:uncharacterized membrane protein YgcG